jgi:hypothetical protein
MQRIFVDFEAIRIVCVEELELSDQDQLPRKGSMFDALLIPDKEDEHVASNVESQV